MHIYFYELLSLLMYLFSCRNLLVAINIAVLLFETASPIRDDDLEYVSLPFFYGAKVNKLILLGEWWRLLTPMFLVSFNLFSC